MVDDVKMYTNNKLALFLHRHIVPVFFSFQKGDNIFQFAITTFVFSVSEQWFLITAGHTIEEIQEYFDNEYELTNCLLIDFLGMGAKHNQPIPFVYKESNPVCLSDNHSFDYGIMILSLYYKQLLLANSVQSLNEDVWKKQPKRVDAYKLLGIPLELEKVNPDYIELGSALLDVEPLEKKPDGFSDVDVPRFYGQVVLPDGLQSIDGMSGGPIFAFNQNESDEVRYWLIAIQSRWLSESHKIAACSTKILGDYLEGLVNNR